MVDRGSFSLSSSAFTHKLQSETTSPCTFPLSLRVKFVSDQIRFSFLIVCNCTSLWGQPTESFNDRLRPSNLDFLLPPFHTSLFLSTGAFLFPKWYDQISRNAPNRIGWTTDTWLTFTDIILITASIPWNYLSGSTYDLYVNRLWNPTWPIHEYHVQLLKNKKME